MADQNNDFNFEPNDDMLYLTLRNPCIIDCQTEAGVFSLIIDRQYPRYLFLQIDGEMRKCYDMGEDVQMFSSDEEAADFLIELTQSDFMEQLIEEEREMNEEWDDL